MRKLLNRFLSWFASIPGEDGQSEWQNDPHDDMDPQHVTRIIYDDEFIKLERPRK